MSTSHTPGPLIVAPDGFRLWSESASKIVAFTATNNKSRTQEAAENARRLAACWNACEEAGLSTQILESGYLEAMLEMSGTPTPIDQAEAALEAMERQRKAEGGTP
jgi:hypothetical protein